MDYFAKNHPTWSVSFKMVESGEYCPHFGPDWYEQWILDEWNSKERLPAAQAKIDRAIGILKKNRVSQQEKEYAWYLFLRKTNLLDTEYYDSNIEDYNPDLVKAMREKDILYDMCQRLGYEEVEQIMKEKDFDLAYLRKKFESKGETDEV
jgi:hypothetical protein